MASAINGASANGKPAGVVLLGCNSSLPASQITAQTGVPTIGTKGNMNTGQQAAALPAIIGAMTKAGTINSSVAAQANAAFKKEPPAGNDHSVYLFFVPKTK